HGVEVRPVDVGASDWDCSLEPGGADPAEPAVRLGLRMVKGLPEVAARRVVAARAVRPFAHTAELAARAGLDRRALQALANAGALAGLAGHRHRANWAALGAERPLPVLSGAAVREGTPLL